MQTICPTPAENDTVTYPNTLPQQGDTIIAALHKLIQRGGGGGGAAADMTATNTKLDAIVTELRDDTRGDLWVRADGTIIERVVNQDTQAITWRSPITGSAIVLGAEAAPMPYSRQTASPYYTELTGARDVEAHWDIDVTGVVDATGRLTQELWLNDVSNVPQSALAIGNDIASAFGGSVGMICELLWDSSRTVATLRVLNGTGGGFITVSGIGIVRLTTIGGFNSTIPTQQEPPATLGAQELTITGAVGYGVQLVTPSGSGYSSSISSAATGNTWVAVTDTMLPRDVVGCESSTFKIRPAPGAKLAVYVALLKTGTIVKS